MTSKRMVPVVTLAIVMSSAAAAQDAGEEKDWGFFPVIASSEETGMRLGAMAVRFLHDLKRDDQSSALEFIVYGTTKGQVSIYTTQSIFLGEGRYRLWGEVAYDIWRANYFGVGNDTPDLPDLYEMNELRILTGIENRLTDAWMIGAALRHYTEELEPDGSGSLDTSGLPGATGGSYTGLGVRAAFDTRDNTNAPLEGNFVQYEATLFESALGSDYDFNSHAFDIRHYFPISTDRTLAVGARFKATYGDVPMRHMPTSDGLELLRGIENRRYIDKALTAAQAEYRYPIAGSWSGTVFAELAQVAPELNDMRGDEFKTSFGLGLRYALNPEQRFNLRADFSWVDDRFGVIVFFREAF